MNVLRRVPGSHRLDAWQRTQRRRIAGRIIKAATVQRRFLLDVLASGAYTGRPENKRRYNKKE